MQYLGSLGEYTREADLKQVQKIRAIFGFHQIKQGHRPCLRCDKYFHSEDLRTVKICNNCKTVKEREN